MTKTLLQQELFTKNGIDTYRQLDQQGHIVEAWERDDSGWHDVTAREKIREKIEDMQEELRRAAVRAKFAKEASCENNNT